MKKNNTKAIIIAAGRGFRLRPFTNDLPKGLLRVGKDSIIGSQIKSYRSLKINSINIIVGYKKNKFKFNSVKYFENKNYMNNNILESLFCAKKIIKDECIISYSDIIFKEKILKKIINIKSPISIVVDSAWKKNYIGREYHPHSEAEKVFFDRNRELKKIGKDLPLAKTNSEFIGMLKLTNVGCDIFKKYYLLAKKKFKGKKFFNSVTFEKAYITDFMKFLLINKVKINCIEIKSNWKEIDTTEDLAKAQNFFFK